MIDPYAKRAERVYVVELIVNVDVDGNGQHTDERELPGRFAHIADALRAYPGARLGPSIRQQLTRVAAREDLRRDRRRRQHITVG